MFVCVDESYNASLLQKLEQRLEKYYNGQASIQYYEAAQNGNEEWGPTPRFHFELLHNTVSKPVHCNIFRAAAPTSEATKHCRTHLRKQTYHSPFIL